MLSVTCRRKEVLLSGHPACNLGIKPSLFLLLVGYIWKPTGISHQESSLFGSWMSMMCFWFNESLSVWLPGALPPQLICVFCAFLLPLLPPRALAPIVKCLRPWFVAILPWLAKSPSRLESHLSIKNLSNYKSEERDREQSMRHSKSRLDSFKSHYPFCPSCTPCK